jgi:hypothetical protein
MLIILVVTLFLKCGLTPACMSRCVANALCGRVSTRKIKELTLANPRPAMAYSIYVKA